jgi:hypothetical protein
LPSTSAWPRFGIALLEIFTPPAAGAGAVAVGVLAVEVVAGVLAGVDVDFLLELPHAAIASAHTGTTRSVGNFLTGLSNRVRRTPARFTKVGAAYLEAVICD